jgi:hypothetical protein
LILVLFGLLLRGYHYLRNPAMWHDEAALVLNVLGKSFSELLGPLYFSEAAPPLFLWAEKVLVLLLGESTYALRLLPFLASSAVLVLGWMFARRCLSPSAALWFLLLLACSDRLLWHACEAKPYALDVFAAVGLLALFVRQDSRLPDRQLLLGALLSPVLIFLSFPACFLLGGTALAWLPSVFRSRKMRTWLLYGVFLAVLGGSFLLLLLGPIHAQRDDRLLDCWSDMFPDWQHPGRVPGWLIVRTTEVFRYAYEPVGNVLIIAALVGIATLWRQGHRRLLVFLLAPLTLAVLAAMLGQYPYGASRVMVFATPAILLLMAAGFPEILAWLLKQTGRCGPENQEPRIEGRGEYSVLSTQYGFRSLFSIFCSAFIVLAILFPVSQAAYRVVCPWIRADSARASALVRDRYQVGDRVVGTMWEHAYYCRKLNAYHPLIRETTAPPTPVAFSQSQPQRGKRLWLLAAGKTLQQQAGYLREVQSAGTWIVKERHPFMRTTVFLLTSPRQQQVQK